MDMKLVDNEKVIYRGHPSSRGLYSFYLGKGLLVILLIVLLGFLSSQGVVSTSIVVLASLVLVATLIGWGKIRCLVTMYTITSQRIRQETGVFVRNRDECPLHRIQNVKVQINLVERALGIGRINIETASDAPGPDIVFWGIKNPYAISSTLSAHFPDSSGSGSTSGTD